MATSDFASIADISSAFTDIANAIRTRAGTLSAFKPAQMASEILNIPSSVLIPASIMNKEKYMSSNITSYVGNEVAIMHCAFCDCYSLETASFPECKYIGRNAFYYCNSLTTISFPKCEYIEYSAFSYCTKLRSASFPKCSYIDSKVFYNCYLLSNISFPECEYIGDEAFRYCGISAGLWNVSFPKVSYIGAQAFYYCTKLTTISFPKCEFIANSVFEYCINLSSLYLLGSSIVSLNNTNAFNTTPLSAGGTGKIYVPSSLYNTYITSINWSTISARIVSM